MFVERSSSDPKQSNGAFHGLEPMGARLAFPN